MYYLIECIKLFTSPTVKALVVAQLVEQLLGYTEAPGSNSANTNFDKELLFTANCFEKTKIMEREAGNGSIFCLRPKVEQT